MFPSKRVLFATVCAIYFAFTTKTCTSFATDKSVEHDAIQSYYTWIDNNVFKRILEKEFSNKIVEIHSYVLESAIPAAEEYNNRFIRVFVTYGIDDAVHEIRFLIKGPLLNNERVKDPKAFEGPELANFEHVVPELSNILESVGDTTKIAPRIYELNAEHSYVIMEDLGYRKQKRINSLSVDHFKVTFGKLARMHAASLFLNPSFRSYHCVAVAGRSEATGIIEAFAELTKIMPGFESIAKKLENSSQEYFNKTIPAHRHDNDLTFLGLCHGDLWMNHLWFKYDTSGRPIDVQIMAFQSLCWGPVVTDIASVFYTSSNEKIRSDDWDELVQYYHSELIATLKKLNYSRPLPTLTELQVQLLERGISFAALGLFEFAERYYTGPTLLLGGSKNVEKRFIKIKEAKDNAGLKFMLNFFDRKGYFDL